MHSDLQEENALGFAHSVDDGLTADRPGIKTRPPPIGGGFPDSGPLLTRPSWPPVLAGLGSSHGRPRPAMARICNSYNLVKTRAGLACAGATASG